MKQYKIDELANEFLYQFFTFDGKENEELVENFIKNNTTKNKFSEFNREGIRIIEESSRDNKEKTRIVLNNMLALQYTKELIRTIELEKPKLSILPYELMRYINYGFKIKSFCICNLGNIDEYRYGVGQGGHYQFMSKEYKMEHILKRFHYDDDILRRAKISFENPNDDDTLILSRRLELLSKKDSIIFINNVYHRLSSKDIKYSMLIIKIRNINEIKGG